jgi:hypothetical protein
MKMHYCTCRINLAGQGFHIIDILATEPMSWPEIQLMMAMHGDENVYGITPIATAESSPADEKRRLSGKYRGQLALIERVYPGRIPQMELLVPGQLDTQPAADEYGIVLRQPPPSADHDDDEPGGSKEPPMGPAIMRPGATSPPVRTRSLEGPGA